MSRYRFIRHLRTQQERRANQDGYCRPKRRPHRLPTAWDDYRRSDLYDRSWKGSRRTQYRVKSDKKKKSSKAYGRSMSKREHFYLEHSRCYWKNRRCNYCRKNHVWEAYDKYWARQTRRREAADRDAYEKWYKYDDDGDRFSLKSATIIIFPQKPIEYIVDNGKRLNAIYHWHPHTS